MATLTQRAHCERNNILEKYVFIEKYQLNTLLPLFNLPPKPFLLCEIQFILTSEGTENAVHPICA